MRLVESVAREFLHEIENVFGFFIGNFVRLAACEKFLPLCRHFLGLLLAHGPAENVRLPEREAGQPAGDLHDLFLIQDDAVGFFENVFELREFVADARLALLAVDEVVDHAALDGTGPVECVESR